VLKSRSLHYPPLSDANDAKAGGVQRRANDAKSVRCPLSSLSEELTMLKLEVSIILPLRRDYDAKSGGAHNPASKKRE
jgi:hypothetical protein